MLQEAAGTLAMVEYGAALAAPHTAVSYARLGELAGALGMPPPPAVEDIGAAGEVWARVAGLYHAAGTCGRDGHWGFQCW